jgi:hypothetical protein
VLGVRDGEPSAVRTVQPSRIATTAAAAGGDDRLDR